MKSDFPSLTAALALAVAVVGCGRDDVQSYRVAKEEPQGAAPMQPQPGMPPGHPDTSGGLPEVKYKTPAGWQEVAPGEMRVASFHVAANGKTADVSVVPLPGQAGSDLDNLNRWRDQVGLSPVTEAEMAKIVEPVEIAGQKSQLYDVAGTNPGSGDKTRILAGVTRRDGIAWFFKMTGDDALAAQQKPAFIEFLKSVTFAPAAAQPPLPSGHPAVGGTATMPPAGATAPAETPSQPKPQWQVPAGWREVAGGQFLVAKFVLGDNADTTINVSASPGDGGGAAANVNRWRGQLGVAPLADADLAQQYQPLDISGAKATLVDISGTDSRTGQKSRLVAAIVPHGSQTWFYKLMGGEQVVAQQKDAFTKFVQSAKY